MLVGDELGVIEARYQPMKTAPAEAQWTACQPCSFSLFQNRRRQQRPHADPDRHRSHVRSPCQPHHDRGQQPGVLAGYVASGRNAYYPGHVGQWRRA